MCPLYFYDEFVLKLLVEVALNLCAVLQTEVTNDVLSVQITKRM